MKTLSIIESSIPEVKVIKRNPILDDRGFFERLFCRQELEDILGDRQVLQINRTLTKTKGAIRGLHFQHSPSAEVKLVSCTHGTIFDVAVDVRMGSPTFMQWHGEILSAKNARSLYVPEGFAHGFQALTNTCELIYLHTSPYASHLEDGINAFDPKLSIEWPHEITQMSNRDLGLKKIDKDFKGVVL